MSLCVSETFSAKRDVFHHHHSRYHIHITTLIRFPLKATLVIVLTEFYLCVCECVADTRQTGKDPRLQVVIGTSECFLRRIESHPSL